MKNILTPLFLISLFFVIACKDTTKNTDTDKEVIVAPESNIEGDEVSYSTDTTTMNGYIAFDKKLEGKRPGVLVVHEWWGHNEYARKRARMLADLGYVALAVDMYGDGSQANHPEDAGKFAGMVMSNIDVAKARFEAAMAELKENPMVDDSKLAAIGYCFGGSVVLSMANAGYDLDAVAAFHSGVQLPIPPSDDIKANILVANGAEDPMVSEESVERFKSTLDSLDKDYRYISYDGVKHSFTNPDADSLAKKFDLPLGYDEEADKDSWEALKRLLSRSFAE